MATEPSTSRSRDVWGVALALSLAACGGGAEPLAATSTRSVVSASGAYVVQLEGPAPSRGNNRFEVTLKGRGGSALSGAARFDVVPWMPAMGHETSVRPTLTPHADGTDTVDNVVLYMPGTWELRATVDGTASGVGPVDTAVISFEVE